MATLLEIFKILLPVITFVTGVIKIIEFIQKIKTEKMVTILKHTFSNPVGKILITSVILTLLIYLVPWHNFHYGNQPVKIVYRDTSIKPHAFEAKKTAVNKIPENVKKNPHIQLMTRRTKVAPVSQNKIDTVYKAKNLVAAPNYGNQQVGDNNVQNNLGKLDHHPQQADINAFIYYLHDKTKTIVLAYETPDSDSANYCKELKSILEQYGYKVELFGHLNIGTPPQASKMMVDTVNYRISVEWNYN